MRLPATLVVLLVVLQVRAAVYVVTTTADSGAGSLRQAILDSNGISGGNVINFNIPPGGVQLINPLTPLPTITQSLKIDGRTQPGFSSAPVIQIDGKNCGPGNGLRINSTNCRVNSLSITEWKKDAFGSYTTGNGILVETGGSHVIQGNYIGLDTSGAGGLNGNQATGVYISESHDNLIGGTDPGQGNVISANGASGPGHGVELYGSQASNNRLEGNLIGTDPTGMVGLGNSASGVEVAADSNVIGGAVPGAGNVISGNGTSGPAQGVQLVYRPDTGGPIVASNNVIKGNLIGTDRTGLHALGNTGLGIAVGCASFTQIGGPTTAERNVISGNGNSGIFVGAGPFLPQSTNTLIQGNLIGTDITGAAPLANANDGIIVDFSDLHVPLTDGQTLIGGTNDPGEGNLILANGHNGVTIMGRVHGVAILGNSIAYNGNVGIDLGGDGITENDSCDADVGANTVQNFPGLNNAYSDGYAIYITGKINSEPNREYRLQFFWTDHCDGNNHGQGRHYIGTSRVTTDSTCGGNFAATFPGSVPRFTSLTATATSPEGNTSEFSFCYPIVGPPPLGITRTGDTITIAWSNDAVGWVLQYATSITLGDWVDDPTPAVIVGSQNTVTEPVSASGRHYRLRSP